MITFTLTEKEELEAKGFMENHGDCTNGSPIYEFQVSPGFGYVLLLKCSSCGYIRNITDTESF